MTIPEFVDWQHFVAEHPLPVDLADIHNAMQMALQANIYRTKDSPPIEPREFLVMRGRATKAAKPLTQAQRMRAALKD